MKPRGQSREPLSVRVPDAIGSWIGRTLPLPAVRVAYRIGHWLMRGVWAITRPTAHGAKILVLRGDEVLFVRLTYGKRDQWDLPGGTAKADETPEATARRELKEETGLSSDRFRLLGTWDDTGGHGLFHGFLVEVGPGAEPKIDGTEIAEARWFARDALPAPVAKSTARVIDAAFKG